MRTTTTLPSLALAGAIALGAVACGQQADPTGESTEQMSEDMDDEMTEDMDEEMDDEMTEDMTDGNG